MDKLLTAKEAAEICNVKVTTIWRWSRQGKLKYFVAGYNDYRYSQKTIEEFIGKEGHK